MPLSIRNEKTVALARDVASRTGRTVTQTIQDALERENAALPVLPRLPPDTEAFLADLHREIRAASTCSRIVDKAFFDSLYDE